MSKSYSPTWRLISVIVLRPLLTLLIRNKWAGRENIPRKGPVIIAPNHLSYVDWGTDALFLHVSGRYPTFLIKDSAFKIKFIGPFLHKAGQLPVHRGRADAALVLKDAEKKLAEGAAVVIYPESTATRDPNLWPMVSKTGAARLALSTGAPVIPVAHWGAQDVLPYGSFKPHVLPRRTVHILAGPPVDLSAFAGQPLTSQTLRAATAVIMADITRLLGELRGLEPPAEPYHPAIARRKARQEARERENQAGAAAPAADSSTEATPT